MSVVAIDPDVPFERVSLDDGSWVEVARGWLAGADQVYETLYGGVAWQASKLFRYDHWVEERRLGSMWRLGANQPLPHPVLADVHKAIERRYRVQFTGFGLIQYRDGNDGQAFHRDTDMRYLEDTVIAILTLGAQRPWHLRPRIVKHTLATLETGKGATHDLSPGAGDLMVMGGRCQADWEHSVPYLLGRSGVGTRISLQWRFARKTGKPFAGTSYRAPVHYSR